VPVGGTRPGVGGQPVSHPRRDVVDAIRYLAWTGCQWDALPVDLPPRPQVRRVEGRSADPSAALVDAQAVRGAEDCWPAILRRLRRQRARW